MNCDGVVESRLPWVVHRSLVNVVSCDMCLVEAQTNMARLQLGPRAESGGSNKWDQFVGLKSKGASEATVAGCFRFSRGSSLTDSRLDRRVTQRAT